MKRACNTNTDDQNVSSVRPYNKNLLPVKTHLIIAFVLIFIAKFSLSAQEYRFSRYDVDQGLCHGFVYTIQQSTDGYLWLGTGEGLCRFDGLLFTKDYPQESLSGAYVSATLKKRDGTIWYGHNDGRVSIYKGNGRKILNADTVSVSRSMVVGIAETNKNTVLVATQYSGIYHYKEGKIETASHHLKDQYLYAMAYVNQNIVMLGTGTGLFLYDFADTAVAIVPIAGVPEAQINSIYKINDDKYLVSVMGDGVYEIVHRNNRYNATKLNLQLDFSEVIVQEIYMDRERNIWLATFGAGAIKISNIDQNPVLTTFNDTNGLGSLYVKTIFQDIEGNMWFGTYGQGLSALIDNSFTFLKFKDRTLNNNITAIVQDKDEVWAAGNKTLVKINYTPSITYTYFTQKDNIPADVILSLHKDNAGNLWIGTEKKGLYRMTPQGQVQQYHFETNSLGNIITDIKTIGNTLWLATRNGIYKYDILTHQKTHYSTNSGLTHNNIYSIYVSKNNSIYYATKSNGIYSINNTKNYPIAGNFELEFSCLTEDNAGNLWAGTYGDGVFKFTNDTLIHYGMEEGIRSDYCYSIVCDSSNTMWIGHRMGISRISPSGEITIYDQKKGFKGDCNFNSVSYLQGKIVWGTSQGIFAYNATLDNGNAHAPITSINGVYINDKLMEYDSKLVLPYGKYKLKIDFAGINFAAPEKVRYSYKMEGFDNEWSALSSEPFAKYSRLEDGNYTFKLKSVNSDGVWTEKEIVLKIKVRIPFWKSWWFISSIVLLIFVGIYVFIKMRERKMRLFQEHLQSLLDERTAEVVLQKEEIEEKNKDITASINYASRIQKSMLPSLASLQEYFKESFLLYLPRDIVSGDFFWFSKINEERIIIVAADCTGHGVPGSMVSMIGMTLIKDICLRRKAGSPAEVLSMLEDEFQLTLNQNSDAAISNDGMDITVCEINPKTNQIRVASAMRSMLIFTSGDILQVKGDRYPIGGSSHNGKNKKQFINNDFQLKKDDVIYLFSDGYVDQFGGKLKDKFKMFRLKALLEQIADRPMNIQYELLKNNFVEWRGKFRQIDDVLFMGVKL